MSKKRFQIIGISDNHKQFFGPEIHEIISSGKIFSGGRRHHDIMASELPCDAVWIDVSVPLNHVYYQYEKYDDIVIFASGDPLFYGYACTLQRVYPDAEIRVYPTFNSLQLLAHRLLLPYADMINVSVTGRPWKALDVALIENHELIGVLTDHKKNPAEIAKRMLEYGYDNYELSVGERLGNDSEKIYTLSLNEASQKTFANPNCVILHMSNRRIRYFGIPENLFEHLSGRSNMITKMPVRLLALSMLDLYDRSVMWDVGFCTGSVSIEAKLQFPTLDIVAFERREESKALLEDNCRRFGVPGITGVIADFMSCDLSLYPRPDAVFIGGHGGKLKEMVRLIFQFLNKDGVVVFNSVSEDSCASFINAVEDSGGSIEEKHTIAIDNYNKITILKAR